MHILGKKMMMVLVAVCLSVLTVVSVAAEPETASEKMTGSPEADTLYTPVQATDAEVLLRVGDSLSLEQVGTALDASVCKIADAAVAQIDGDVLKGLKIGETTMTIQSESGEVEKPIRVLSQEDYDAELSADETKENGAASLWKEITENPWNMAGIILLLVALLVYYLRRIFRKRRS